MQLFTCRAMNPVDNTYFSISAPVDTFVADAHFASCRLIALEPDFWRSAAGNLPSTATLFSGSTHSPQRMQSCIWERRPLQRWTILKVPRKPSKAAKFCPPSDVEKLTSFQFFARPSDPAGASAPYSRYRRGAIRSLAKFLDPPLQFQKIDGLKFYNGIT